MQQPGALKQVQRGLRQRRAALTLLVMVQLWLFTNGPSVLGREFPVALCQFYLFFMMWPLIVDHDLLAELLKGTVLEYAVKFTVGYVLMVAGYFLVFVVGLHVPATSIAYSSVGALMAVQLFFVTPAEELFFRAFVPRLYNPQGKSWRIYAGVSMSNALWTGSITLADVATSASFSAFHYAAYGGNAWFAFVVAFTLSMAFLYASRVRVGWPFHLDGTTREMGIALTWGMHFAFNMCAFGVLTGGVVLNS